MKRELLDRARLLGFDVYQDLSGKWIVKGYENHKLWLIKEKEKNRWLVTFDGTPQMLIETKIVISIISKYIHIGKSSFPSAPGGLGAGSLQYCIKENS